jgi:hypothetical protein
VVVVISTVVLVDEVVAVLVDDVVEVLVDAVVEVRWVVVVLSIVVVVCLALTVVVVSRVVLGEGRVMFAGLTGGMTIGRVVGGAASVEAGGGGLVPGFVGAVDGLVAVSEVNEVEDVLPGGSAEVGTGVMRGRDEEGAGASVGCLWAGCVKAMAAATPAPTTASPATKPAIIAVVSLACRGIQRQLRPATASRRVCADASEGAVDAAASMSGANAASSWESISGSSGPSVTASSGRNERSRVNGRGTMQDHIGDGGGISRHIAQLSHDSIR